MRWSLTEGEDKLRLLEDILESNYQELWKRMTTLRRSGK